VPEPPVAPAAVTGIRSNSPRLIAPVRLERDDRVDELRRELARSRAQLAQLEEFRARYRARFPDEADLDCSEALTAAGREARALLDSDSVSPPESGEVAPASEAAGSGDEGSAASSADLRDQTRELERRLEIALYFEELQRLEIEQLRRDLTETRDSLAEQTAAEQELSRLLELDRHLLTVASETLIGMGAAAVPQLVAALGSEETQIRLWAAEVLGAMGADARSALPDLLDAASDADAAVRAAVRRAAEAIEQAEEP
jgi:hypothetical protein